MSAAPRVTTLPNGLRVATEEMASVETTSIGIWTNCGTRHEPQEVNGVAHMLEHMLFKGTERRTAQAIAEEMETVGGHMNAYTSRENTAYYARVLRQDSGLALDMLADILQHSRFAEEDLARERYVVLQELGQAMDTPDDIIHDYFHEAAYPDQPVGRSILGTEASVGGLTRSALKGYIDKQYAPGNLVLAAAGAVDHDWLVEEAARLFRDLPTGMSSKMMPARYRGGDFRKVEPLEQIHLMMGFPAVGFHDPDYYAVQVFSTALGGGMSSRLFQEIRERRGLVYTIQSFVSDFEDGGVIGIYAGTGADSLAELVPVLCGEIVKSISSFEATEIGRAKAQMRVALLMGLESSFNRAETLALNLLSHCRVIPVEESLAKIEGVTLDDLVRVGHRMLSGPPTITALGDIGDLPDYGDIAARLAA
jgi:predicted Zn-dependent peptidase